MPETHLAITFTTPMPSRARLADRDDGVLHTEVYSSRRPGLASSTSSAPEPSAREADAVGEDMLVHTQEHECPNLVRTPPLPRLGPGQLGPVVD